MRICASCGAQIEDGMKFCGGCGAPVADAAEAAKEAVGAVDAQAGTIPQQTSAIPTPSNTADAGQNYGQTQQFPQQQYNNFQQQAPAAPKQPNPLVEKVKKNPLLAAIPAGALVVLIILIVVVVNVTKYQKVDAQKLFNYDFEGLNNYGTLDIEMAAYPDYIYESFDDEVNKNKKIKDTTGIDEDFLDEMEDLAEEEKDTISPYFSVIPQTLDKTWTKAKNNGEMEVMRNALLKQNSKGKYLIKAKADKEKNLKNGDKIKITVEYDKDYLKEHKIKLTNTEFTVEVKNLEEGIEFNAFDEKYLNVTFDGLDGEGTVNVETTGDALSSVWYDYDYYSGLSNGDKVTVTCETPSLQAAGKAFYFECDGKYYIVKKKEDLTKEYEVTGLKGLEEIDVFENIEFTYDRGTPFLRVKDVNNDNMDKMVVDNVNFLIENGDSLKVGDKFTVKAYSYSLNSQGYKIKGEPDADGYVTKEFTVEDNMPAYVTADNAKDAYNSADLKDIIADEETEIKTKLQGTSAGWLWNETNVDYKGTVEKIDSMVLKDVYVAFTSKNNYSNVSGYINRVYGLYEVKVKTDDEEESSATLYALIYMDNILTADGKFYRSSDYDTMDYYFYGTMNDFNKEVLGKEGYTVTKSGSSEPDVIEEDSKPEETTTTTAKEEDSKAEESSAKEEESKAEESEAEESAAEEESEAEETAETEAPEESAAEEETEKAS